MSESTSLKETVLKDISSIIASAPRGLTPREAEADYKNFIGNALPLKEMGFANAKQLFESLSGDISMTWERGEVILRAIPNEKTERIISLVQRNKPGRSTRRTYRLKENRSAVRGRGTSGRGYPRGYPTGGSTNYQAQSRPNFRPARVLRPTAPPGVPPMIRGEIRDLLVSHPSGISIGANFNVQFKQKYGCSLNFQDFGFSSMTSLFMSMQDLLHIEHLPTGGRKVKLCHPPVTNHHRLDVGSGCNDVTESNVQKILGKHPGGIFASKFQQLYRHETGEHLPYKSLGYGSVIEYMDSMHHLVSIEKNATDWILFDHRLHAKQKKDPTTKEKNTRPQVCTAPPVPDNFLQTLQSVVSYHDGLLLDEIPAEYKNMTGHKLNVEDLGFVTLQDLILNCVGHVRLKYVGSGKMLVQALDADDGMNARSKQDTTHRERSETVVNNTSRLPPDAVGPGCCYTQMRPNLTENSTMDVVVSQVDRPDSLWIQIRGQHTTIELENVMNNLEAVYTHKSGDDYRVPEAFIQKDLACAAIYWEGNDWHRVLITNVQQHSGLVDCDFVDYGTAYPVQRDKLRLLKKQFMDFPKQALEARLAHLQPTGSQWTDEAKNCLLRHVNNGRSLEAIVSNISDDYIYSICLTERRADGDMYINDTLVEKGHAIFVADEYSQPLKETMSEKELCAYSGDRAEFGRDQQNSSPSRSPSNSDDDEDQFSELQYSDSLEDDASDSITGSWPLVKLVQFTEHYSLHLVRYCDEAYVVSAEISALFWEKDLLRSMIRQKKLNLPKVIIMVDEHPELSCQLRSFGVRGIQDGDTPKSHLTLYQLSQVRALLEAFSHPSEELLMAVEDEIAKLQTAKDASAYWKETSGYHAVKSDAVDVDESENQIQKNIQTLREKRQDILKEMQKHESDDLSKFVEELMEVENRMRRLRKSLDRLNKHPNKPGELTTCTRTTDIKTSELRPDAPLFTPSPSNSPLRPHNAVAPVPAGPSVQSPPSHQTAGIMYGVPDITRMMGNLMNIPSPSNMSHLPSVPHTMQYMQPRELTPRERSLVDQYGACLQQQSVGGLQQPVYPHPMVNPYSIPMCYGGGVPGAQNIRANLLATPQHMPQLETIGQPTSSGHFMSIGRGHHMPPGNL